MPNKILFTVVLILFCFSGLAQCDSIPALDLNRTCKVLKSFINFNVNSNQYDKVLSLILTYDILNESCNVPIDTKKYINSIKQIRKKQLENILLTMNGSSTTLKHNPNNEPPKSRQPFIIEQITN